MRRVVVLLVLAILVNFPWEHELWVARQLDAHGRDTIVRVISYDVVEGRYFVRYRVPGSRATFSARVVKASYDVARQGGELRGTVVPGSPGQNRVDGEIQGHGFMMLALIADGFLVIAGFALWMRRRRSGYDVRALEGDDIVIDVAGAELITRALPEVRVRLRVGGRSHARLSLVAHTDLVPGEGQEGITAVGTATYRIRGRVVDVGPGWVEMGVGEVRIRVRVGELKARADLRERAEVVGEFWLA